MQRIIAHTAVQIPVWVTKEEHFGTTKLGIHKNCIFRIEAKVYQSIQYVYSASADANNLNVHTTLFFLQAILSGEQRTNSDIFLPLSIRRASILQ